MNGAGGIARGLATTTVNTDYAAFTLIPGAPRELGPGASGTLGLLGGVPLPIVVMLGLVVFFLLFVTIFAVRFYRKCPPNQILVISGRVGGDRASKCLHGGGRMVIPLLQQFDYLNLEPIAIDIPLEGALSLNNIRVNVPATFTVGISTDEVLMNNAAERLLGMHANAIRERAQDIILGQLRLVIATLSIEEINKDREKFMRLINENVGQEINKIGLELINVNVRDITDESGYIQAIGKRAAAEAVNRAKVEVAQQEREGATGESVAVRERNVNVAREVALAAKGQKDAEQDKRVALAAMEAEAVKGEAAAQRDIEIVRAQREAEVAAARKQAEQEQRVRLAQLEAEAVKSEANFKREREVTLAERESETVAARKEAEQLQRVRSAAAEATAVEGESASRQKIAHAEAQLAEIRAEAKRRAEVAAARALEAILQAERDQELARMAKDRIAPQEIEKKRIELAAAAEAEKRRIEAQGEADGILARFEAEAAGVQKVLEAKAEGYRKLIEACGTDSAVGPTLLLIEQLPKLVAEQVKAVSNLKIDKITVWDGGMSSGGSGRNTTADWVAGMVGALPKLHELAQQAGIELPPALGRVGATTQSVSAAEPAKAVPPAGEIAIVPPALPAADARSASDGTGAARPKR